MSFILKTFLQSSLILATSLSLSADDSSPVLSALKKELTRTMTELKSQTRPPYYLSYCVSETHTIRISASFGKLEDEDDDVQRILDIDLRVGDYLLDNTHAIRGQSFEFGGGGRGIQLPRGNDELAIRKMVWLATDREYKKASERYGKVLTNRQVKVKEEDSSADFSHQSSTKFIQANQTEPAFNKQEWRDRLRRLSAIFAEEPFLLQGKIFVQAEFLTKYFVNSEGSEIQSFEPVVRCFAMTKTKADDGMTLPLYRSYAAFSADRLPSEEQMSKDCREMVELLKKLQVAPLAETYTGPAILSGRSSGVFFHEIFGHRVEGHRQKDANSSQTFKSFLNKKILPDFIDVVFDPTAKERNGTDLVGYYKYDDEGVEGQKVVAVQDGIFKNFLMSRSPIENFPESNGHGRRQAGYRSVSRQSNLFVLSKNSVSYDSLKSALREECKKQNKEYGLLFDDISGGFTFTGRTVPNAFNVQPLVVYKVFADGRPDELVRGVDLIGTPLATFNNITLAANDVGIFNGVCGAESGGVPVSASSPSIMVKTIEVQKKAKSQAKPPILRSPVKGLHE